MRFFQSESHSKPDDNDNDNDTVRSEPVPVPRTSAENDTDRGPDTADTPHLSGGRHDADADNGRDDPSHVSGTSGTDTSGASGVDASGTDASGNGAGRSGTTGAEADRPHVSTGFADEDVDRDGRVDDETRPAGDDSSVRHGEPVDADVVPDEPVFVEPAPQETAFGAATVGGAVAASEQAARREVHDPAAHGTTEGFGTADERDGTVEGFGPAGTDPHDTDPHDTDPDKPVRAENDTADKDTDETGSDKPVRAENHADEPSEAETHEGFGSAPRTAEEAGRASHAEPGDHPDSTEGFGAAGPVDADKPLRAENVEDDRTEGEPVKTDADTTALGVAAGAAAGAVAAGAATKDRDRDGHPDSQRVAPDGAPLASDATAAVPIEPVPAPADAIEKPATTDEPVELLPGDVPDQPALAAFFAQDKAADFRDRWREVQLRFVDDPAQAASDAGTLIDEVVTALNAAVTAQRKALGGDTPGEGDTERLRVLVRRQRDFLDRILGL